MKMGRDYTGANKIYLELTTDEKNKKDIEKLFKLASEIKKQQEIIKKAQIKIANIQEKHEIIKYSLIDADDKTFKEISNAAKILKYGHEF